MRNEEERSPGPRAVQALPANERRFEGMKRSELTTLAHELAVHQVELEMQNQELREARTATEEARARYIDLFDSAPVGYFLLDEHIRIVEANLTGCRLLQVDRRSTRNEPFSKFLAADDADRFYLHRRKVLEEEVTQSFETRVLRGDGTPFWAQLDCAKTGREGLRLAMTDISERKKDEEALRENERRLQIIASNSPDHILLQDSELRYQFVTNPQLGLTREGMIGKTDRDILSGEDGERLSVIKRRVIDTGKPYHLHTSLMNKEGRREFFDGSYIPVFDTAGEPSGLAGYFRNVTAAKEAETALKLERENYRNSLEMSPLGVQVVAPGGEALFVNPALLNMMGYGSLEEWNSVPLEHRLGPEGTAWVTAIRARHQRGEPVPAYEHELTAVRKDGRLRILRIHRNGMIWNGKTAAVILYEDTTHRKRAEEEIQLSARILKLLNAPGDKKVLIRTLLQLIKDDGPFDAVGIRLRDGDHFPYLESDGFAAEHVRTEDGLCAVDDKGEVLRDGQGNPVLECVCGSVIRGRFDPAMPYFTESGSFWTNSTTDLLASTTAADRRDRTRNRCHEEGYESVALMPIKGDHSTIGLLQINDTRRDRFTLEAVKYYESLAHSIGIALAQRQAEDDLRQAREFLQTVFDSTSDGMCTIDVRDFSIVGSNEAFRRQNGVSEAQALGKTCYQLTHHETVPCSPRDGACPLLATLASGKTATAVHTHHVAGEEQRFVEVSTSPIRDAGGSIVQVVHVSRDITERKRAEDALARSESEHRELAESISDIFFAMNREMRYTYWNKASEKLTGVSAKDALGKHFLEIFPDSEATRSLQALYLKAIETGQPMHVTAAYPGGNNLVHDISAYPSGGGVSVFVKDVTEQRRAEEDLRTKAHLLDAASDGILIHDEDGQIYYVNEATALLHGYSKQEMENVNLRALVVPPEDKHFVERVAAIRQTGGAVFQLEHYRKDGSIRPFEVHAQSIVVDGKKRVMSVLRDISQRNRVEEALLFSDAVLKSIHEAVFALDNEAVVTHWNPICEKLFGIKATDAVGRIITELISIAEEYPGQNTERVKLLRTGGFNREEQLYRTPLGEVWLDVHSQSMESGGRRTGWVTLALDITGRKKAEEERARLEQKAQVASRLAAVGGMAAGIAHEINNPLTGVIGFSRLLLDRENVPEELKDELGIIADGSQRVADIVKRLLIFSRQTKPVRTMVDVNGLVDNTLKLRDYVLRTAGVEVISRFDPKLPWVTVDAGQLQQVFMNMIVNAEQSMKESHGKGTLIVTTEMRGDGVRISFKDDGAGITKENMAHLFEPFFTTKAPGDGTGLGLSLSRSIVLEHGGQLAVESEFGHGATFIIDLPFTDTQAQDDDESGQVVKVEPRATETGRILVVDDESSIRGLIKRVLTGARHSVDTVSEAAEALDKLDAGNAYDVIICDIRMPGMNGMELYAYLREKSPLMAERIVFVTGDTMGADVNAFLNGHKLAYLAKPFTVDDLKKKVYEMLRGGRSNGGSPEENGK